MGRGQDDASEHTGERDKVAEDHSAAAEARRLMRSVKQAALATQAGGQPFASLVTPAVARDGAVLMLLSSLSEHTRHLVAEARCSLLFVGEAADENPQTAPRVSVSGVATVSEDTECRGYWLARHPYAEVYAGFTDFLLWRVLPETAFYVGGFARAVRLVAASLLPAAADVAALAAAEAGILAHCNADHAIALNRIAWAHGRGGDWIMIGVDCDGFDLLQDRRVLRISFKTPVGDAAGVRSALVTLLADIRGDQDSEQ